MKFGNKIKNYIKKKLNENQINQVNNIYNKVFRVIGIMMYPFARYVKTPMNLIKNKGKRGRILEIGPGPKRVPGFETINVVWGKDVDYVADASKSLPFKDGVFDLVFASHVLEHTPWFDLLTTLTEWSRVIRSGGYLEVWIPDGYKLAKMLVDIEEGVEREEWKDGWQPLNPTNDPYRWINGRLLYGVKKDYPSWHVAIITPRYLKKLFAELGMVDVERLSTKDVRGVDHGWINLGFRGRKP